MTISSVATAAVPSGNPETTSAGASGLGALFAGLLDARPTGSDPVAGAAEPVAGAVEPVAGAAEPVAGAAEPVALSEAATAAEILGAAQVMAAAQVLPITPVLAATVALRAGGTAVAVAPTVAGTVPGTPSGAAIAELPPHVPAGPPTGTPTGPTAVSAGGPVLPSVPPSAVPLAAPAATEQAAADGQGTPPAEPNGTQDGATAHGGAGHQQTENTAAPVTASNPQPTAAPLAHTPSRHEAVPAAQVTGQVFPEVARLVSRGDGTRRITLKLSPEALGDVRVVLTVRDGDVQVRMIGSEQAQQALRAGAPELQRLLDLAGASSSSVIVGDQGSAPDPGQPGADRHLGDRPADHRTAGTRDGYTSARDGSSRGPQQRSSTDPSAIRGDFTRAVPGVDVTM